MTVSSPRRSEEPPCGPFPSSGGLPSALIGLILLALPAPVDAALEAVREQVIFQIRGDFSYGAAYRVSSPHEFTKLQGMVKVHSICALHPAVKLRVGARARVDSIYD